MDTRNAFSPLSLLLVFVLLVGSLPQVYWITRSRDELVTQTVMDDAFYYFQTSRNVAQGAGSVSAGGVEHNGYHPLWMLVCAGFFRIGADDLTTIRLILAFGVVLELLAALAVYRLLLQLRCTRGAALFGAACFHLNPWMQILTVCGLEAPLNALLLALTTSAALRVTAPQCSGQSTRNRSWLFLGILMGLTYLVRTDNVFYLGATVLLVGWRMRQRHAPFRGLVMACFLAGLAILPWTLWNWHTFGSLVQGSASALPCVRKIVFFEGNPGASDWTFTLHRLKLLGGWFPAILYYSGLGSLWFVLLAAVCATLVSPRGRALGGDLARAFVNVMPLALAVLALGIAHKFFRLATREWYYVTPNLFLALLSGGVAHFLTTLTFEFQSRWSRLVRPWPLVAACLFFLLLGYKTWNSAQERLKRPRSFFLEILDAVEVQPDLRPGEMLGITDSGTVGFFSSHPALNLDGVVNPEAANAIREGRLLAYVRSKGIRYLVITPRMFNARLWGKDFDRYLEPTPLLTPQGYHLKDEPLVP
jgi:hypothetical protein